MLRHLLGLVLSLATTSNPVFATPTSPISLQLVRAEQGFRGIDQKSLSTCVEQAAHTITTTDPNFLADGPLAFQGCDLSSILQGIEPTMPVTILGNDQYILATTAATLRTQQALVARLAGNTAIAANRGGPIKLVMKAGSAAENYVWYVRTVVVGASFADHPVIMRGGRKLGSFASIDRDQRSTMALPAPRGSRLELNVATGEVTESTSLSDAVAISTVAVRFGGATTMTLHDLTGNQRKINVNQEGETLMISCSSGTKQLMIRQGGPCIMISRHKVNRWLPLSFITQIDLD